MASVPSSRKADKARRPDPQQSIRQWSLLRLLADASEPYSARQFADQLDVSEETIERDLATFERDFAVIRGFLRNRRGGELDARGQVNYEAHQAVIDQLVDAIARRRVCEISYQTAPRASTRRHATRPLRLVWHHSALYLVACLDEQPQLATLAVHRIRDLKATAKEFARPRVDVDGHIANAFGVLVTDKAVNVEVHFDAEIASHVEERTFHADERKRRLPDGTLRYEVRTRAQWEIIPWVASFGPLAELIAPTSWREALRANVDAMLRRYRPTSGSAG